MADLTVVRQGHKPTQRNQVFGRLVPCCSGCICTPLNSIIEEQLARYGPHAVKAKGRLGDAKSSPEARKFVNADYTYVIGHPEDLVKKETCDIFVTKRWQKKVSHIVIDEAHSVLQWGAEFRPEFLNLPKLRSIFPNAHMLALTATATTSTRAEIAKALHMKDPNYVCASIDRKNIKYVIKKRLPNLDAQASLESVLCPLVNDIEKGRDFPKTIVYGKLKTCGSGYEYAVMNVTENNAVSQYHAACTDEMKHFVLGEMANERSPLRLLFATEAYSMGTDAPDVRRIVHIGVPTTLETYIQEVGRGGRDGGNCEAVMFYNNSDIASNVPGMADDMREYCRTNQCRRLFLCNHFGFDLEPSGNELHSCCDVCEESCECVDCHLGRVADDVFDKSETPSSVLIDMLTQYIQAENHISGELFTHLSVGLVQDVAKFCANATNISVSEDILMERYPFVGECYIQNLFRIIDKFNSLDLSQCDSQHDTASGSASASGNMMDLIFALCH